MVVIIETNKNRGYGRGSNDRGYERPAREKAKIRRFDRDVLFRTLLELRGKKLM